MRRDVVQSHRQIFRDRQGLAWGDLSHFVTGTASGAESVSQGINGRAGAHGVVDDTNASNFALIKIHQAGGTDRETPIGRRAPVGVRATAGPFRADDNDDGNRERRSTGGIEINGVSARWSGRRRGNGKGESATYRIRSFARPE